MTALWPRSPPSLRLNHFRHLVSAFSPLHLPSIFSSKSDCLTIFISSKSLYEISCPQRNCEGTPQKQHNDACPNKASGGVNCKCPVTCNIAAWLIQSLVTPEEYDKYGYRLIDDKYGYRQGTCEEYAKWKKQKEEEETKLKKQKEEEKKMFDFIKVRGGGTWKRPVVVCNSV